MCSVVFLPVYSLLKYFKSSLTCFVDFVSFVTITFSDSKAFQRFIVFSGSPTAVHHAFLFFDGKPWPQSQTDLFTCTMVLHCGHTYLSQTHRPIALQCMHYGITLCAYLSEPLVKDSHKSLSTTEKPPCAPIYMIKHLVTVTYVLRRGIRKHCTWRKWLT